MLRNINSEDFSHHAVSSSHETCHETCHEMFSNESAGHEIFRNELALGLFFLKSTDSVMVASHQ